MPPYTVSIALPTSVVLANTNISYHVMRPSASAPSFQPKSMITLVSVISLITPQIESPSWSSLGPFGPYGPSGPSELSGSSGSSGLASRIRFSSLSTSSSFTSTVVLVASSNQKSLFVSSNGSSASNPNTLIAIPSSARPTTLPLTQASETCARAAAAHASSVSSWCLEASVSPLSESKQSI